MSKIKALLLIVFFLISNKIYAFDELADGFGELIFGLLVIIAIPFIIYFLMCLLPLFLIKLRAISLKNAIILLVIFGCLAIIFQVLQQD